MAARRRIDSERPQRLIPLTSECFPSIDVSDLYFEVVYGPFIGPTAVALARNLTRRAATADGAVYFQVTEVALELGLRASHMEPIGRSSSITRAFDRLHHHRLLTVLSQDLVEIYVSVPPLDPSYLPQLPDGPLQFHRSYLSQ